jgi:hypothetical protein
MAVDWDAFIINRTLGTDVATSVAGSMEDSDTLAPVTRENRASHARGWLIGIGVVLAWTIWRRL